MSELSYGQASARLEEILGRIEDGRVDVDELSGLVREAAEIQVKTITEQLEREGSTGEGEAGAS